MTARSIMFGSHWLYLAGLKQPPAVPCLCRHRDCSESGVAHLYGDLDELSAIVADLVRTYRFLGIRTEFPCWEDPCTHERRGISLQLDSGSLQEVLREVSVQTGSEFVLAPGVGTHARFSPAAEGWDGPATSAAADALQVLDRHVRFLRDVFGGRPDHNGGGPAAPPAS